MIPILTMLIVVSLNYAESCGRDEFLCGNGECISSNSVCNGWSDCYGSTDETEELCSLRQCSSSADELDLLLSLLAGVKQFRCDYGACIPDFLVCDGMKHCNDGSDETAALCQSKKCRPGTFKCGYGGCISIILLCNGLANCFDGSDETAENCRSRRCPPRNYFRCDYGACVWHRKKCNGRIDCFDGSDEDEVLCSNSLILGTTTTTTPTTTTSTTSTSTTSTPISSTSSTPSMNIYIPTTPATASSSHLSTIVKTSNTTPTTSTTITSINPFPTTHFTTSTNPTPTTTSSSTTSSIVSSTSTTPSQSADPTTTVSSSTETPTITTTVTSSITTTFITDNPSFNKSTGDLPTNTSISTSIFLTPTTIFPLNTTSTTPESPTMGISNSQPTQLLHFPEQLISPSEDGTIPPCPIGHCRCPPPQDSVCVDCPIKETIEEKCNSLNVVPTCSRKMAPGVSMTILYCGLQVSLPQCGTTLEVPAETVALVRCWETARMILTCQQDGLWHSSVGGGGATEEVCQTYDINSKVCGSIPKVYKFRNSMTPSSARRPYVWPWMAGIFRFGGFWCTGTIIAKEWVLTAGQCVSNLYDLRAPINPKEFYIQHHSTHGGVSITNVSEVFIHSNFSLGHPFKNDVGLLRLQRPLVFSIYLTPACVRESNQPPLNLLAFFNRIVGEATYTWDLITQTFDEDCNAGLSLCDTNAKIENHHFCGINSGDTNKLQSSLGGPTMMNQGSNLLPRWTAAGVTSLIPANCNPSLTVFTSIAHFWPWINQCIYEDKC